MSLKDLCRDLSVEELLSERAKWQKEIDENDGRLTSGSSYWLDYALDNVDDINAVLKEKGHHE